MKNCPLCGASGIELFNCFECPTASCRNYKKPNSIYYAVAGHQLTCPQLSDLFKHTNPANKSCDYCLDELAIKGMPEWYACTRDLKHEGPHVAHNIDTNGDYLGDIAAVWSAETINILGFVSNKED